MAEALSAARVRYCQWKGHFKQARWMAGEGDIDMLVDQESFSRFGGVLGELGLKRTTTDRFWGYDALSHPRDHACADPRHDGQHLPVADRSGAARSAPRRAVPRAAAGSRVVRVRAPGDAPPLLARPAG